MDLLIPDISRNWNHIIQGLRCLASFTRRNVFKVHALHFLAEKYSIVLEEYAFELTGK